MSSFSEESDPAGAVTVQRRFALALVASVALHALFLGTMRQPNYARAGVPGPEPAPLTVRIVEALREEPVAATNEPVTRTPIPQPVRPHLAAAHVMPHPAPKVETLPQPPPERVAQTRFDMAALIEAHRARRRAAEEAALREEEAAEQPQADAGASAIQRNLMMVGDDGVGGIFEILYKGTSTAQYAFNGWRPDTHRQWREVIEVNAPAGGDIELAIVRSMVGLIRTHYTGDFRWESRRLGKVVVLSARLEDNGYLEEFLMREFFGTPLVKEARPR